jgi:hypothetical protein
MYAVRVMENTMAFLKSRTEQVVFLLELLKPCRIGEFGPTFTVADGNGEPLGLLPDLGIVQRLAFDLLILCPIGQRPFDVRKFTLCLLCRTLATIIRVQELFLLSENFGNSTTPE